MNEVQKAIIREKIGLVNRDLKIMKNSKSISTALVENLHKHYSSLFDVVSYASYDETRKTYEVTRSADDCYVSVKELNPDKLKWIEVDKIIGYDLDMEDEE